MQQTTLSYVESHFSEMYRRVIEEQDIFLITQENGENIVMMPQSLFESMGAEIYQRVENEEMREYL